MGKLDNLNVSGKGAKLDLVATDLRAVIERCNRSALQH